jgi:hypothetical protein
LAVKAVWAAGRQEPLISDRFPGGELAEHDPEKWRLLSEKIMLLQKARAPIEAIAL